MHDGRTIGVITSLVSGPYYGAVLTGVARQATASGLRVVVFQTLDAALGDGHPGVPDRVERVAWDRVAGVVVVTAAVTDGYLADLHATGRPIVLVSHRAGGLDLASVAPDNHGGVRQAVRHLHEHGHRRIAFVGHPAQADLVARHQGYQDALRELGLDPDPTLLYPTGSSTRDGGERAAALMVAAGVPCTAVVTGNDLNALGLVAGLRASGYRVPEDVAVVGFDDAPEAEHHSPPLSTVTQHIETVGEQAVRLMHRLLAGDDVAPRVHPVGTTLVVRSSCGCTPGASTGAAGSETPAAQDGPTVDSLARALTTALPNRPPEAHDEPAFGAACRVVAEAVVPPATARRDPASASAVAALHAAVETIYRTHPRGETVGAVIRTIQDVARTLTGRAVDAGATRAHLDTTLREVTLAFGAVRTRDQSEIATHLQLTLAQAYDISMELLHGHRSDPASLAWLRHAPVHAGCLALWSTDGRRNLEITGTYGLQLAPSTASAVRPEEFPPPEILDVVDAHPGTEAFVLPIRTEQNDWGLLSVVGLPEAQSPTGRETYFEWAAMLGAALDYGVMLDALRRQQDDLTAAFRRERDLAASFRSSEERYALAASATNDGLWDWDLATDRIFFSRRWKAMLGHDDAAIGQDPREWLGRVHTDDAAGLEAAVDACRTGASDSLEHEHRIRAQDGLDRWVLCRALAVPGDGAPAARLVGSMTDVTERRQLEDQLRQQALFDTLTGLPNRTLFLDRLGHAIGRADRHPDAHFAVVFLDLDGFKVVNDSLGHATGDGLLREVAQRLRAGLRSGDTVARLGGDEFAVLLEDVDLASVPDIAHMIQERLAEPYDVDGTTLVVTASAGVALSVLGYARAEDVLRNADIAMYRAKTRVRGSCTIFDPAMRELVMTRMRTETELRLAIEAGDVIPRYQPIVRLDTGQVTALEALARWRKPGGRELLPGDFLSVAEETGLIVPMSRSLVGQVCDQLGGWRVEGVLRTLLPVAVNVSHREFWHADLLGEVTRALDTAGLDPSWLVVEITESVLMDNAEAARVKLRELHAAGLRVHVDDFGTGYSSLEALHRFSIDALKIDRSFVSRLGKDPRSEELIRTIVMMAEGLGLDVIAEGVETVEQQRILVGLGCPRAQGYLFARPMTPERIAAYLPAHQ